MEILTDVFYFIIFYTSSGTSQTLERSVADAANDAQKLATNPEDSQFTLSDGTTGFSALHRRQKQKMKTAAQTAKTQAETARDTAQNHKDDAQKLALQAEDSQFTLTDGVTTGYSALVHYSAKAQLAKTDAEAAVSTTSGHVTTTTQNASDSANARADALKIASNAHNSQYTLADATTTGYSALHYATEAANTLSTFQGQYHGQPLVTQRQDLMLVICITIPVVASVHIVELHGKTSSHHHLTKQTLTH